MDDLYIQQGVVAYKVGYLSLGYNEKEFELQYFFVFLLFFLFFSNINCLYVSMQFYYIDDNILVNI